jgi:hypothetical protein
MNARPLEFDQAIADRVCEQLTQGLSLRKICLPDDMPVCSTIYKWLTRVPEFAEQYAHARESQADTMADEIVDIADGDPDGDPQRDRLRVDARKWVAAKLKPKKYGDKSLLGSDPDNPLPTGVNVTFRNTDAASGD